MVKKSKTPAPIEAGQSVSDAFETILRHNLTYGLQWVQVARSWDDIEGVHQLRVSFRRMRSALSAFRGAVPSKVSDHWSEELRWLGGQMGLARDMDVFIDESLTAMPDELALPGKEKMAALAERVRATGYETVREMLDGERFARFKDEFPKWLDAHGWRKGKLKDKHRKRLDGAIIPFGRRLLDKLERQVLEAGNEVDTHSQPKMHRLRIKCKKLRYGAEFFLPLFKGMATFIGHMKGLQDLLGTMNDVHVMQELLDQMLKGQSDCDLHRYAGGLVGWRTCQFQHHLESFDSDWEEFHDARHPWWSKDKDKAQLQAVG